MARKPKDVSVLHGHRVVTGPELRATFEAAGDPDDPVRLRRRVVHGVVLVLDGRNVIAVGDSSVPDLGGRFVERRLDRENLERAARLALDGALAPVITAVHPLSDAPAALATVENGHTPGKVVIKVA